ncbi:hypothetical protein HDG70_000443 [Carboxydothermus ferrireducens DSM 11255]|uniref:Uncharacterized protein n=1 Tax=Carboxydothermus ferrireducens DSM 11255 TaxID=1119529 RepID=A0ABX2R853_9THEO|nr:hypothetical protein [Carboxydothermus ferrireducens DSM 11255]
MKRVERSEKKFKQLFGDMEFFRREFQKGN